MVEVTRLLGDALGLHARPAVLLASEARKWGSDVRVCCGARAADGKDPMALMALEACAGDELRLSVEGPDEAACAHALTKVLADL